MIKKVLPSRRAYQPGELLWNQRASEHIARFLWRHRLVAHDPHASLVLLRSAALAWELRQGEPSWAALSVGELFRRLRIDQEFFPDPALVLAHYEVLHVFVAWLGKERLVEGFTSDRLLDELGNVRTPFVEDARKLLRTRREALERCGSWHEVLRTMKE